MPREATLEDMPALLVYLWRFYQESGYSNFVEFDPERLEQSLGQMIESEDSVVLISEAGTAGALVTPLFFTSDLIAQELFWWVSPEARGNGMGRELKSGLEEWAKEKGAKMFSMSSIEPVPKKVARAYRNAGYKSAERSFIRSL